MATLLEAPLRHVADTPRGILRAHRGKSAFALSRPLPSLDLAPYVENYWISRWDLRGARPYVFENLPTPTVHLVFEDGGARIYGVVTGRFTRRLEGRGCVFGVKFRPGGFAPFARSSLAAFTDRVTSAAEVFPHDPALEASVLACWDEAESVALAEDYLRAAAPAAPDEMLALSVAIVDHVESCSELTRVDELAAHFGLGVRTLQRVLRQYVGVGPKWIIRRARQREAAERLARGEAVQIAALAASLGYFDEAHFVRDFRRLVGTTPGAYARTLRERGADREG
ncbi:helix-turn-helix domain-containing protein [Haliangium ochraceum]|uniref:Transcriptional regulator, AraC family n=1 Tax=Haliangium ochraceum (strain DSM 14365 / JCM 11303 / SMP-2) TaxID=502025 RepID=D0LMH9_HALO1|nr:helix-turn-helix domain-containing protein [Haliangium ochraceum]ACY18666.1 transcriptional regulator, AraC family [Haliangium ochraceum DSM 14365]